MTEDVRINGKSVADYGCILIGVTIGKAQPRITSVQIPGMDGVLDTSRAIDGKLHYDNRDIKLVLQAVNRKKNEWLSTLFDISNDVDAQTCTVVFDSTPNLMFVGRGIVEDFDGRSAGREISITLDAEPTTYRIPHFDVNPKTGQLELYTAGAGTPAWALEETELVVYQDAEADDPLHSLNFAMFSITENVLSARW